MNLLDFSILAGWPGSAETWQFMQNMLLQLQQVSLIGGTNYIVSGCVVTGGNTGNGIMVINGEIVPFVGGPSQPNVVIVDTPTKKPFFGGAQNNYYHSRQAVFGTGAGSIAFSTLKRNDPANGVLSRLDKVEKMLKPLCPYVDPADNVTTVYGSWLFWGRPAAEIPAGWQAVPDADWKGKFPVVMNDADVDFDTVGETGGAKQEYLSANQIPPLTVTAPLALDSTTGGSNVYGRGGVNGSNANILVANGAQQAVSKLPPYKVVMFIRFIG